MGSRKDEELELPYRSYSVSNIQSYFVPIIKKQETLTDNFLVQIYINRTEKRITF